MGFATALSGLAAAQADLQVIGNNIANANTVGFKESRTEFADLLISSSATAAGPGVRVAEVAQQFKDGNIESTNNNLDLAISGNGFFALGDESGATNVTAYTRNGAFQLTPEGYLTNDAGFFLMGGGPRGTKVSDGFTTGTPIALKVDTAQGKPSATTKVDLKVNLDSRLANPATAFTGYDSAVSSGPAIDTYNSSTTTTIFDSLGNTHTLTTYFVNASTAGAATSLWNAYLYIDGKGVNTNVTPSTLDNPALGNPSDLVGTPVPMAFDSLGDMLSDTTGTTTGAGSADDFIISGLVINPTAALSVPADPLTITLNPTNSTQFSADFGVNDVQQDGFASGNLTGISFDKTGVLAAKYSNGTSSPLGQVLLGRFTNNQGLSKLGNTTWQESSSSGTVVLDVAGGNNFGDIQASALEGSNTDIATQLVKMIVAQQAYQANAQTISTEDEIIQRILQL